MSGWGGVGAAYAASYSALCAGTADAIRAMLGPARAGGLLDVGSGTGELAAALTDAGWRVAGCEPEPTMREISRAQHPAIPIVDGALPSLPYPDAAFAAVTANFVLNHVADPRAAAAEMARVTASGGVLAATTWTVSPSWFWMKIVERARLAPVTGEKLPADKDFERTAAGFERMLRESGWHAVKVQELSWTWHAQQEALWASVVGGVATAGAFYRSLGDGDRSLFRRAFDEVCSERAIGDSIALEHTAAVASASAV